MSTLGPYRFGPADRRGVMLGLGLDQVLGLAGTLVGALVLLMGDHSGAGALLVLGAGLAWSFLRFKGRPVHAWFAPVTTELAGSRRSVRECRPQPISGPRTSVLVGTEVDQLRTVLPGVGAIAIEEIRAAGWPIGVALVGRGKSFTFRVCGPRFALADRDAQDEAVGDWAAVLASCADGRLRRLQLTERVVPDPSGVQGRWLERAATPCLQAPGGRFTDPTRHDVYVTAALSGGSSGVGAEAEALVDTLERFGFSTEPLSAENLARLIGDVVSGDRGGPSGLFSRGGSRPRGVAWERAWDQIRTAGLVHAGFEATELPRVPVGPDWVWPLIATTPAGVRRTLALHIELAPPQAGLRRAARAVLAHAGDADVRARYGFRTGARQQAEAAAAAEREAELAAGFADSRFVLLVGVAVDHGGDLDAACRSVQGASSGAQVEIERLWGQQAGALAGLLPLGHLKLKGGWS